MLPELGSSACILARHSMSRGRLPSSLPSSHKDKCWALRIQTPLHGLARHRGAARGWGGGYVRSGACVWVYCLSGLISCCIGPLSRSRVLSCFEFTVQKPPCWSWCL